MIELLPIGDRELWVAHAQDNSWALPVFVEWRWHKESDKHYALIMPAVGLYTSQHLALRALLGVHDIQGRDDQWIITRKMCEAILSKAPGITPLAYYRWPDPHCPAMPLTKPVNVSLGISGPKRMDEEGGTDFEELVKHISHLNGTPSSVVRMVMRALADAAPKWMIESRRALDLGFCKLVAVPFRPNWKEIVAYKFKRYKLCGMMNLPNGEKWEALDKAGLPGVLCSPDNIGVKRDASSFRVSYSLEAVPNKAFDKAATLIEARRLASGSISYVASFEKTVEALYHHLVYALEGYLKKTQAPFARVSERGNAGFMRFLPTKGHKVTVRGVGLRQLPVHIIPPNSAFSVFGANDNTTLVRPKAPPLPALPTVPQGTNDLRGCDQQGNLVGEGSTQPNGVPVLDASEGEATRQPMLPGSTAPDGDPSRMDGEGDRP